MHMKTKIIIVVALLVTGIFVHAKEKTGYYFSKTVNGTFEEVTALVKSKLKEEKFGVITEIDMDKKLAEKLEGVEIKPYKILGVCNPGFANQTLQKEENIGLFLPCKMLIKEIDDATVEVVMVNPSELMKMIGNKELLSLADEVTKRFKKVMDSL